MNLDKRDDERREKEEHEKRVKLTRIVGLIFGCLGVTALCNAIAMVDKDVPFFIKGTATGVGLSLIFVGLVALIGAEDIMP